MFKIRIDGHAANQRIAGRCSMNSGRVQDVSAGFLDVLLNHTIDGREM
jgi:hypothetical protein